MHKAIKEKIENNIYKSFLFLEKKEFKKGIDYLEDTKIIINSFLSNNDIKQIYLKKEELVKDQELISSLEIFDKEDDIDITGNEYFILKP